jgi:hypothetical protein
MPFSVDFQGVERRNILEDRTHHSHCCEYLKSHVITFSLVVICWRRGVGGVQSDGWAALQPVTCHKQVTLSVSKDKLFTSRGFVSSLTNPARLCSTTDMETALSFQNSPQLISDNLPYIRSNVTASILRV